MEITREMFDEIGPFYMDDLAIDDGDQDLMFEVFKSLPLHDQHIALEWGCNDTVFRDNAFEFLCKKLLNMTCEEYYESDIFKNYINHRILIGETMKKEITKIAIFDFDGTLFGTPLPEEGKPIWLAKTGEEWPHKGWWSKRDSLRMDIFDIPLIDEAHQTYLEHTDKDDVLMIMMTGRITPLGEQVKDVIHANGLKFDRYEFCSGHETLPFKLGKLRELREEFPDVKEFIMLDDREPHIQEFIEFFDEEDGVELTIKCIKYER